MAGREDEAQAIVADVIVEGGREIRLGMLLPGQQLGTELLMLAVQQLAAAKLVDGAVGIGRRHRLASFCAMRALTSFRTSLAGRGWSAVKRMVPLAVWYDASSFLRVFGRWVLMKRLR